MKLLQFDKDRVNDLYIRLSKYGNIDKLEYESIAANITSMLSLHQAAVEMIQYQILTKIMAERAKIREGRGSIEALKAMEELLFLPEDMVKLISD